MTADARQHVVDILAMTLLSAVILAAVAVTIGLAIWFLHLVTG